MPARSEDEEKLAQRAEEYAGNSDMTWVMQIIAAQRDEVLAEWLEDASELPFHQGRREHAVADHIPALFDALIAVLQESAPRQLNAGLPLEDERVRAAVEGHALDRAAQGLRPADVVVEIRLLRQEISRAIRRGVPDDIPVSDLVGTELVLNDCLDSASALALSALTERIEREREDFLATVVHETRQPLTVITGHLQLAERAVLRDDPDLEQVRGSLSAAGTAARRMHILIATLADASRVALGGVQLERDTTDLRAILDQAVQHLPASAARRVRIEAPEGLDAAGQWDAARLLQVVINLLSNAVKYAPGESPILVTLSGDETSVMLKVRDYGVGIPPAELPRLFARYSRASNAIAEKVEGLGLGLYLCWGIVDAHGGRIWAESDGVGQGTTITFTLPRTPPASKPDAE